MSDLYSVICKIEHLKESMQLEQLCDVLIENCARYDSDYLKEQMMYLHNLNYWRATSYLVRTAEDNFKAMRLLYNSETNGCIEAKICLLMKYRTYIDKQIRIRLYDEIVSSIDIDNVDFLKCLRDAYPFPQSVVAYLVACSSKKSDMLLSCNYVQNKQYCRAIEILKEYKLLDDDTVFFFKKCYKPNDAMIEFLARRGIKRYVVLFLKQELTIERVLEIPRTFHPSDDILSDLGFKYECHVKSGRNVYRIRDRQTYQACKLIYNMFIPTRRYKYLLYLDVTLPNNQIPQWYHKNLWIQNHRYPLSFQHPNVQQAVLAGLWVCKALPRDVRKIIAHYVMSENGWRPAPEQPWYKKIGFF